MTATRTRKQVKTYAKYRQKKVAADTCVFCDLTEDSPQTVSITAHFKLFKNIFPYSVWDNHPVKEHLLLAPKLHTHTLDALSEKARLEFVKIISDYEAQGYNVYARGAASNMRSVDHQHTHLIKLEKRFIKFLLFLDKPYIRWVLK